MILILSTSVEQSTAQVIKWLNFFGEKWLRINKLLEHKVGYTIDPSSEWNIPKLEKDGQTYTLDEVHAVWYRRREKPQSLALSNDLDALTQHKINTNIFTEEQALFNGLVHLLSDKKWLSHPSNSSLNKLYQLQLASRLGLKVPATLVSSEKEDIYSFRKTYKQVIVKNIRDLRPILDKDTYYIPYVKKLDDTFLETLPNRFFPSLFQKYIPKKFELRVFFIGGKIFSMAMFSQEDNQTAEDFRRYNNQRPTRRVPYQLPLELEAKIRTFMDKIGLNTGSLDFIYSQQNEYIFLEVNPVGQFGMVSYPCNYNLNKEIAKFLARKPSDYE